MAKLEELRAVEKLNSTLRAEIAERTELVMAQAKVEVLDTALEEWQSLRSGTEPLQLSDQALAPSERVELSELLQNYPAQKAMQFAMEEYQQAISEVRNELNEDTMPTTTVETPRRKSQTPPPRNKPTKPEPRPKPAAAFWKPLYRAKVPSHITAKHWAEFKRSAIHPDLIALNAESVSGQEVYERLLSERLAQLGSGQYVTKPMSRLMAQYEQVAQGGWWGKAGIDAQSLLTLAPGEQPQLNPWGCFKADRPRIDQDKSDRSGENEYIKYENPLGVSRSLYLPIMPAALANRIYKKHGIQPTEAEKTSGFWYVVRQYNLPITITEGAKKTWASLSQGEVTIGVSGVNGLYRAKDQDGYLLPQRQLNEEMAVFATPGREFRFAFDQDIKTSTILNVRRDLVRGIELLEAQGCICKVATWRPEDGKGLDDLIINRGPLAYTEAIATAQASDQTKRTHYRTQYNAIARQVRVNYPEATTEFLDAEVYLRNLAKAEAKDGDRFIAQGDNARSLKTPEQVTAYVDHIKAHAPEIRQQYLEAIEAHAKAEAQRVADRAEFLAIAQQVKAELGDIPPQQLDMEVYLRAGANLNIDPILGQSDQALSLDDPTQVQSYIERIKAEAPAYQQQKQELAEIQEQKARDRREYLSIAKFARRTMADFREDQVDLFVCLSVGIYGEEADRVLAQSDQALALQDPVLAQAYIDHVKAQIPVYHKQKQLEEAKTNRARYEELAGKLRPGLGKIQEIRLDAHVYRAAVESGQYSVDEIDGILSQSKSARALKSPDAVRDYLQKIKEMEGRPKFGRHRTSERAIAMSEQNKLNRQAVEPCKWLAKYAGEMNIRDGSYLWQIEGYTFALKGDHLKVKRGNELVLESNKNGVDGSLSAKEIQAFHKLIDIQKDSLAKQRVQQLQQSRKQSQSRKHHRR